jgi:hypothetical protein
MSPRNPDAPPRNGTRTTALIALAAALLGGTGGAVITPHANNSALVTKEDLREILAPVNTKLSQIETAVSDLRAEAAVTRYEREHRTTL